MQMRSAWRQGWLVIGLAGLMALSTVARADATLDWLKRAVTAARQQNYSGIYVYHRGEHIEVLRILHRADASGEQERVEVMDGAPRLFVRTNNDVYCHLPDGKQVRFEHNTPRRFFPSLLPAHPARLLEYYDAKLGAIEPVAGRPCQRLTLEPRDDYRYVYDLWLDQQTGLPLKSRVIDSNGDMVSMYAFSEVQIGKAPGMRQFRNDLAGKHIQKVDPEKPADVTWIVTPPPGYERVQQAVRSLPGRKSPVTHLVFSDGLSVLSMFIEPVDPQVQRLQGLSAEGTIGVYAHEVDGYTVTTLGEVPNLTLIETGNSVKKK